MQKDFDAAKPGDLVIFDTGSFRSTRTVESIERVTSTQIIVKGMRFRRNSGRRVGESGWNISQIWTPEGDEVERVRMEHRRVLISDKLHAVKWAQLPLETLVAVDQILSKP